MSNPIQLGTQVTIVNSDSVPKLCREGVVLVVEAVVGRGANLMVTASYTSENSHRVAVTAPAEHFQYVAPKQSEAEKLQDLLESLGEEDFCKVMAETIEKHNKLHLGCMDVLGKINEYSMAGMHNHVIKAATELHSLIKRQLDK